MQRFMGDQYQGWANFELHQKMVGKVGTTRWQRMPLSTKIHDSCCTASTTNWKINLFSVVSNQESMSVQFVV